MTGHSAITRARRIVFWVFFAVFVVTWPPLLFFALGVEVQPDPEQPVVPTGAIRVESLPPGATIELQDRTLEDPTPAVIDGLEPGQYSLTLTKSGYRSWSAAVTVTDRELQRISPALLLPNDPSLVELDAERFSEMRIAGAGRYLVLLGSRVGALQVYDTEKEAFLSSDESVGAYDDYRVVRSIVPAERTTLFLHGQKDGDEVFLHVGLGQMGIQVEKSVAESFYSTARLIWEPTLSDAIFVLRSDGLWRLESWEDTPGRRVTGSVLAYGAVGSNFYTVSEDGLLREITMFGNGNRRFTVPERILERLRVPGAAPARIIGSDGDWFAVKPPGNGLILVGERKQRVIDGVETAVTDQANDRFIVQSADSLGWIPFPEDEEALTDAAPDWGAPGPSMSPAGGGSDDTGASGLEDVVPIADGSHVLYRRNQWLWVRPLIPGLRGSSEPLLEVSTDTLVAFSQTSGKLYLSTDGRESVRVLHLVPERPLIVLE
jgi:hypothetical protein